jgi:hypothetical protein
MRKLVATVCLVLGVMGCGPAVDGAEDSLESTEQNLCPTGCPWGTTSMGYQWVCTGQTSSTCTSGYEEETLFCYDPSTGGVVSGGTTCRRRCGCAVEAE